MSESEEIDQNNAQNFNNYIDSQDSESDEYQDFSVNENIPKTKNREDLWGRKKSLYYEEDDLITSDEDKLKEEEDEVEMLRKMEYEKLSEDDFVDDEETQNFILGKMASGNFDKSVLKNNKQISKKDEKDETIFEKLKKLGKPENDIFKNRKIGGKIGISDYLLKQINPKIDIIDKNFFDNLRNETKQKNQISDENSKNVNDINLDEESNQRKFSQTENSEENDRKRRKITEKMRKNEGLKRYRSKKFKNARTKTREKWRRKQIRVKGMRPEYKPLKKSYIGEMTGIKENVVKSIRL
ncbi:something about silencing protein 10 [Bonamia ostreae]|uniref:Something about silencing protein 10 n=1 Tax=Bonamia ostreae TaxID=126728 RepID=A0ABV2ARG6_9EUKA